MKKTRLFALVCLTAALACTVMLAACSSGPNPEEAVKADLTANFDKMKNLDPASLEELAAGIDESGDLAQFGIDANEFATSMMDGFDYEIKDVVAGEDGTTATATVAVTRKSFTEVTELMEQKAQELIVDSIGSGLSMDELNLKVGEIIMQSINEVQTATTDCTFEYELIDNAWQIAGSAENEIYNAFFS